MYPKGYPYIELAMSEYAKEVAIDFFKWYALKMLSFIEYIIDVKPIVRSEELENKMVEFEGKTFEELFEKYLSEKQNITP